MAGAHEEWMISTVYRLSDVPEPTDEMRDLLARIHERESEKLIRSVFGLNGLPATVSRSCSCGPFFHRTECPLACVA